MTEISITRLREVVSYDPLSGELTWLVTNGSRAVAGRPATARSKGYIYLTIDHVKLAGHRVAWALMTGAWPIKTIDHINGQRSDNRWANLRELTNQHNVQNQRNPKRNNKTGFLGVSHARGGKFQASITVDGKSRYLGNYSNPEDAHAAYVRAKRELHPFCTI